MVPALTELASVLSRHRELIWELTRRELVQPQADHFLGRFWVFLHPVLSVLIFFLAFYFIFPTRLEGFRRGAEVYLLSGLIPWVIISELLPRAAQLIRSNANLVKQIVFPLETLAMKTVLASLFVQLVMSAVLLAILFATSTAISPLFLPLWLCALLIQAVFMLGLTLILSSITPFIPDVQDLVSLVAKAGLFLAPVLYTPGMFNEETWRLFYLNPFSYMIWIHHDALFYQSITMPAAWVGAALLSVGTMFLGSHVFRATSPSFAEAI